MDTNTSPFWTVDEFAQYMKITPGAARESLGKQAG